MSVHSAPRPSILYESYLCPKLNCKDLGISIMIRSIAQQQAVSDEITSPKSLRPRSPDCSSPHTNHVASALITHERQTYRYLVEKVVPTRGLGVSQTGSDFGY